MVPDTASLTLRVARTHSPTDPTPARRRLRPVRCALRHRRRSPCPSRPSSRPQDAVAAATGTAHAASRASARRVPPEHGGRLMSAGGFQPGTRPGTRPGPGTRPESSQCPQATPRGSRAEGLGWVWLFFSAAGIWSMRLLLSPPHCRQEASSSPPIAVILLVPRSSHFPSVCSPSGSPRDVSSGAPPCV